MRALVVLALAVGCAGAKPSGFDPVDSDSRATTSDDSDGPGSYDTYDTYDGSSGGETDVARETDDTDPAGPGDSDDTADTADTGDTAGAGWRPTTLRYVAELAVDDQGAVHDFLLGGVFYRPYFAAHLLDATHECWLVYDLHPDAFGYTGQTGLSADLTAFLGRSSGQFGFQVGAGLYNPRTLGACATIDPAFYGGFDPHEFATNLGAGGSLFGSFDQNPDASVISAFVAAGYGADIPLGGRFELPVSIGGVNTWAAEGMWALVDTTYTPQVSGTALVLQPRAAAWNGVQPSKGFYRWFPTVQLNFGP